MAKKETERQRHWRQVVEEQRCSGLSVLSFCQERGIKEATLKWWERRIRRASSSELVATSGEASHPESGFIELRPLERGAVASYKIRTASGNELELGGSFNPERVKQLLKLLSESAHA